MAILTKALETIGERPRDKEEERLLAALDKKRWERMTESGDLVRIGKRHWGLKIF